MHRRKEEIRVRTVNAPMGGQGSVYFHDWLLPEEAVNHGRVFSKVVLPVGSAIGYHPHNGEFEAFYVLEGVACVNDNGVELTLYPGDMHMCKNGDSHSLRNGSTDSELAVLALIMKDLS